MSLTVAESVRIRVLIEDFEQAAVRASEAQDIYRRKRAEMLDYIRSLEATK